MIKNYIKTAYRNLLKNKGFTLINVLGLALGLATFLLIVFYVADEWSFDRYNTKADRIFRVNNDIKFSGNANSYAVSPAPLAAALKSDFPEVEEAVRFRMKGGFMVKGNQEIEEYDVVYADPSVFKVFTLPMMDGNPSTALSEPNSVVITASTARKYFNSTDAVGKTLTFDDTAQYKVTGVIKDIPKQSHFNFGFFISMPTLAESRGNAWFSSNFNTYVLLRPGADYKKFEAKLPPFLAKEAGPQLEDVLHVDFKKFEAAGNYWHISLMPLTKIHLESNSIAELGANGNIQYVYIFSAIAIFILLIACVNFMNLSTARSANRAREVGVRKVLGSSRGGLIIQFLTESVMITLAAGVIAVGAAWAMLPLFNQVAGKDLTVTPQVIAWLVPALVAIVLVFGALAGSYPAFFLSGFRPAAVLKGKLTGGFKAGFLRSFLVVFQFAISIFLIIGTMVIYNQLRYIQNKDLGYNRDHVLTIGDIGSLGNSAPTFKQQVKQLGGVVDASLSEALPTWNFGDGTTFFEDRVPDQKRSLQSQDWGVDPDYIPTLGIKIVAGRNFSPDMQTDSSAVIINQSAARKLGYANPLNQMLYMPMDNMAKVVKPFHIIGVMKDFNFRSLRENVTPIVFLLRPNNSAFCLRINSANIPALVAKIKDDWDKLAGGKQFNYSFMDAEFDAMYRAEQNTGTIALAFTSLAIIIACLGLFGLAAYEAEQRTKEIGIRKVLGAKVSTIVALLSKDFVLLVLIAVTIAAPLAWWAMNKWLQSFAYRQNIQWWVIAVAGGAAIFIALVTISFQSVKAALMNPVKSLKSE